MASCAAADCCGLWACGCGQDADIWRTAYPVPRPRYTATGRGLLHWPCMTSKCWNIMPHRNSVSSGHEYCCPAEGASHGAGGSQTSRVHMISHHTGTELPLSRHDSCRGVINGVVTVAAQPHFARRKHMTASQNKRLQQYRSGERQQSCGTTQASSSQHPRTSSR